MPGRRIQRPHPGTPTPSSPPLLYQALESAAGTAAVKTKSDKSSQRSKKASQGGRGDADDADEEEDAGSALNWVVHEARADASLAALDGALGHLLPCRDAHAAALAARLRAVDGQHPDVADSLMGLAQAHLALGRLEEARQSAARALEVLTALHQPADAAVRRALGAPGTPPGTPGFPGAPGAPGSGAGRYVGVTHPSVADALCLLARCHCEGGEYPACKAALSAAMRVAAAFLQEQNDAAGLGHARRHTKYAQMDTHGAAAAVKAGLGELALALGEYDRANDYLESALSMRSFCLGERHPATTQALQALCAVLFRRGKVVFAKKVLLRCIHTQVRPCGPLLDPYVNAYITPTCCTIHAQVRPPGYGL